MLDFEEHVGDQNALIHGVPSTLEFGGEGAAADVSLGLADPVDYVHSGLLIVEGILDSPTEVSDTSEAVAVFCFLLENRL